MMAVDAGIHQDFSDASQSRAGHITHAVDSCRSKHVSSADLTLMSTKARKDSEMIE